MEKEFFWTFNAKTQKTRFWYIAAGLLIAFFVIFWIIQKIYAMSFVFFILPFVYFITERKLPAYFEVKVTKEWVWVWSKFYDIRTVKSFVIINYDNKPFSLRLRLNKKRFPILDIPLSDKVNTKMLTNFLKETLEEEEDQNMNFFEKMAVFLKI